MTKLKVNGYDIQSKLGCQCQGSYQANIQLLDFQRAFGFYKKRNKLEALSSWYLQLNQIPS